MPFIFSLTLFIMWFILKGVMDKNIKKKFKIFLAENDISIGDFAKTLNISYNYLLQIIKGTLNPSEKVAEYIEAATQGAITKQELREHSTAICPTCGKRCRSKDLLKDKGRDVK